MAHWKTREKCDQATGFDQVEDIHHEMRGKVLARMFGGAGQAVGGNPEGRNIIPN